MIKFLKNSKFRGGFTLIEFLIVIALIIVLAFFSWQGLSSFGGNQELDNTAVSISALLRDAQQRSVTQVDGKSWGVKFGGGRYFLLSTAQSVDGPITDWTVSTTVPLDSALKFIKPIDSLIVVFRQISGELGAVNCSGGAGEEIEIGLVGGEEIRIIKVFCSGKVEY